VLIELIKSVFSREPSWPWVPQSPAVHLPINGLDPKRLIDEALHDWDAVFDPNPNCVHIIYREGTNDDGTLNDNRIDLWNDQRCLIRFLGKTPKLAFHCVATTEPGTYYDRVHVIGGELGAALICYGQQACHQVGIHHPGYKPHESLVQTGAPIRVYRDYDRSFRRQQGRVTEGWYGINQHSTGGADAGENSIGQWSAGCLVARRYETDHKQFMRLVKQDARYLADDRHVFDTTVLPPVAR
jgi:hypothetical protein